MFMGGIAPFEEGSVEVWGEGGVRLGAEPPFFKLWGGWLSPPSTLENREFIMNTIKQNLTSFS
jgi:hypothetical protein